MPSFGLSSVDSASSVPFLLPLPWLLPFFSLVRLARREPALEATPVSVGRPISIIIPARNEHRTIATVLGSILATSYHPIEVLVVDDRSTDETAALVEASARADARVRLIRGTELPDGWYGKQWACYQGYRAAAGEILVFTDADTRHGPDLLGHAVGALERERAELVTVAPHQRCETFWERIVMPQVWFLLGLRFHPRVVNRATRPRDVIANGQFIMVTRDGYERAGTHEAVRHEVAEDLALAQTFLRRGLKMHFAFARHLMETRMYHDLGHLVEGWSKNVYLGGRQSYPDEPILRRLVPAMLLFSMLFWLIPVLLIGAGLTVAPVLLAGAVSAHLAATLFWVLISLGMEIPLWYGILYPLGAAMMLVIIARSILRGGRRVEWKGRVYGTALSGTGGASRRP